MAPQAAPIRDRLPSLTPRHSRRHRRAGSRKPDKSQHWICDRKNLVRNILPKCSQIKGNLFLTVSVTNVVNRGIKHARLAQICRAWLPLCLTILAQDPSMQRQEPSRTSTWPMPSPVAHATPQVDSLHTQPKENGVIDGGCGSGFLINRL